MQEFNFEKKSKNEIHVLVGIWKQHDNHKEVKNNGPVFRKIVKGLLR